MVRRRTQRLATLLAAITLSVGCAKTVTAPVPGQLNTFDAYVYRILYDSQAAINSFKASPSASNPAVKPLLNQAISDYNIVEAAYQVWHAAGGSGSTAAIQQGITKLQTDISSIATASGGK